MLDHGIMNFENQNVFDSLVRVLSEKDSEFLQNWEDAYNFQSLRSIYEKAIYEEELFLEKQVAKYGDDPSITREKIGYSEYTLRFLKNESITLDDYGIVEMNITAPSFGSLLNEDRIAKIDGKLYQFGRNEIKIIEDGDRSKINQLKAISESKEGLGIKIIPVNRNSMLMNSTGGRSTAWNASCDNVNGNYRVIGYEEDIFWLNGCQSYWSFWIKLRSLRKILGTWQNYNTGFLKVKGNIKITEWTYNATTQSYIVYRSLVDETDVTHNLAYGSTSYHYYVNQLPTNCLIYPEGYYNSGYKFYKRQYTVYGYNSTACSLGVNPFVVCYAGNCPPGSI